MHCIEDKPKLDSCSSAGNNVTSNLKWDLGSRNVTAGLLKVLKFSQGRFLELGAQYSDKTQLLTLEAAGKPHKDYKLYAAYVLAGRSYCMGGYQSGKLPNLYVPAWTMSCTL